MTRQEAREKEVKFLAAELQRNPRLFEKKTFVDSPEFLEKFGIFIKGKENFPAGYLKLWPQDFIVEEIGTDKKIRTIELANFFDTSQTFSEKDQTIYAALVKCGLSTIEAVEEIVVLSGIAKDQIQFAGIKDKDALTSQLVSFRKTRVADLQKINSPFLFLKEAFSGKGVLKTGELAGNEFTILVRTDRFFQKNKFLDNLDKIRKNGFNNFFYLQRFGTPRLINFYWGLFILRGEYEKAVLSNLCSPGQREFDYFKNLRAEIKKLWPDFSKIEKLLEPFPLMLEEEIKMIGYLKEWPNDFIGALNQIPEQIQLWLFAYASSLFNKKLYYFSRNNLVPPKTIPLVLSNDKEDWLFYKDILEKDGISRIPFANLKNFPYVRWLKREIKTEMEIEVKDAIIIPEGVILNFNLPKAAYATTFLAHLFNLVSGQPPEGISPLAIDTKATLGKNSLEEVLNKFEEVISAKLDK